MRDVRFWDLSGSDWHQMGKFGTFFKISTFWLKLDFKSRICPILCQSDPFQTQIWHTCLSDGDSHSRLPITLMTHTFFTFQSNVGNYYQWWCLFIMFVLDLDFSFEMFHFIQQGFTCTSMDNSISFRRTTGSTAHHYATASPFYWLILNKCIKTSLNLISLISLST